MSCYDTIVQYDIIKSNSIKVCKLQPNKETADSVSISLEIISRISELFSGSLRAREGRVVENSIYIYI